MLGLREDGIRGLQSLTLKRKKESYCLAKRAKNCYLQVLTDTDIEFNSDSDEFHGDSEQE